MKLETYNDTGDLTNPSIEFGENRILFYAARDLIVQPSEIMKVPTDVTIKVPEGFILQLSTHPSLIALASELFPSTIIIGPEDGEYEVIIPVKNNGRNPLTIRSHAAISAGRVLATITTSIEYNSFEPKKVQAVAPASSFPQKRNKDVKFEIK